MRWSVEAPSDWRLFGHGLRWATMLGQALPFVRRWSDATLSRRLTAPEALMVGAVLLTVGTIYCQIYCLLALQKMHGASMPLWASVHRASVDVLFAFAVFELGKRIPFQGRWWQWVALAALFGTGIALAAAWRMQLPIMTTGLSPRRILVDRIPFMTLAAIALVYFHARPKLAASRSTAANDPPEVMPPVSAIEWVKAAGNYVEIRFGDRTRLMRMTLRQASARLPSEKFVQIHRSVIVNRASIRDTNGRRRVRMADGTEFSVGDAYRSNLDPR